MDGLVTLRFPNSASLTQQQTACQYKTDMTQRNAERESRNEAALHPSEHATGDNLFATHVAIKKKKLFYDNTTTLMLLVARDLNEVQKEKTYMFLSPRDMFNMSYTFDAVRKNFVGMFLYAKNVYGESISPRKRTRRQYKWNLHHRKLC